MTERGTEAVLPPADVKNILRSRGEGVLRDAVRRSRSGADHLNVRRPQACRGAITAADFIAGRLARTLGETLGWDWRLRSFTATPKQAVTSRLRAGSIKQVDSCPEWRGLEYQRCHSASHEVHLPDEAHARS